MALILKPPTPLEWNPATPSVFLAGSIEMGKASAWQDQLAQSFAALDVVLLNPRRELWDSSWDQTEEFGPFREQVEWELDALARSTWIAMYFDPATQSPITLLELGLFASSGKLLVACPAGYWRRGNVQIVCRRHAVPCLSSLSELTEQVAQRLR